MTKISNKTAYPLDITITDQDYVIGTDADNLGKITRNFSVGNLRNYILSGLSPVEGGTLRISEIAYTGVLTTPEDVVNALDPDYEVLAYHLVFVKVNGQQFLLKLQDRFIGTTSDAVTNEDFIEFPISVGPQGEQGEQGIQGEPGETGATGPQGEPGLNGVSVTASGTTTSVTGTGSEEDPYIVEIENLQKVVNSFPYTLVNTDDKQTIFIENGASDVIINVPDGLVSNFCCSFFQKGSGNVTIQASGTATLRFPNTLLQNIIKGQYYAAMVEKEIATDEYYLAGGLKSV